ncbi:MAG: TrkH family potassium uptake protein, partial [Clostridia bacterium]|nr:TrkH family potassium uptake protein [Clostridia bacterium]
MNRRLIINVLGKIMTVEGILMIIPVITALYYKEKHSVISFVIPMAMLIALGLLFASVRTRSKNVFARDGYIMTAVAWIVLSFFGALPFVFSGEIPELIDAVFETVSGFTTTG